MKISDIEIIPISIPLKAPIRWPWGSRTEAARIVVRLTTDEGLVGYGETFSLTTRAVLEANGRKVVGEDPFNIEKILARFLMVPYFSGYSGQGAICAVEMACWDLIGKAVDKPVCDLIGGRLRDRVDVAAYIFPRYEKDGEGGEDTPEKLGQLAQDLARQHGFRVFKYKGGVFDPEFDLEVMRLLRQVLGPGAKLRIDPNANWSFETALRVSKQLLPLDLEYLEDPVWGLDAMSRLRRDVSIPFATNMCVVDFDTLPVGIRLGAVDVILGDPHKWGGLWQSKKLAGVCQAFGLGMSIHSGAEAGISTASFLHLAASTPQIYFAIDSHYHHLADDILAGGMLKYENGQMAVPTGPGLGVKIDKDKLAFYAERFRRQGDCDFAGQDVQRPEWLPRRPMW
jgi:glucarate dehydratase